MRRLLPIVLAAIAGVLVAVGALALASGPGDGAASTAGRWQAPDRAFTVALPRAWRVEHGAAATVLQRRDGRATIVVRRGAPLRGSATELADGLERRLREELGEIRPVAARELAVGERTGLLYTFVRPATGAVQSIAVVPTAKTTFTLDAVVDGQDAAVAREVGSLVRSFSPVA